MPVVGQLIIIVEEKENPGQLDSKKAQKLQYFSKIAFITSYLIKVIIVMINVQMA
jgi:hypothetical protein